MHPTQLRTYVYLSPRPRFLWRACFPPSVKPKILLGRAADDRLEPLGECHRQPVDDVVELARDAEDWVAERSVVASPPVALRSNRR